MSSTAGLTNGSAFHPGPGLERIMFFSDAVIAIAVTLLAIDIRPPEVELAQLPLALASLIPRLASFALSFMIIGSFWVGHHATFTYIRGYDYRLAWLNLVFLLFIALIPFASSMLAVYQLDVIALVVYSSIIALAGFSRELVWEYASRNHRLIDEDVLLSTIRNIRFRNLIPPLTFAISIPLIMIDVSFVALWGVVPLLIVLYRKITHRNG